MIEPRPEEIFEQRMRLQKEMEKRYRNVFSSEEGRLVLGDILLTCHFGVPLNSEQERIEQNIGLYIVRMCGILSDIESKLGMVGG